MLRVQCASALESARALEIRPFLKWAGGKRWLTVQHSEIFPANFDNYIEPFAGSAAVYFHLQPKRATLSDLNPELINCYQAIKEDWERFESLMSNHDASHDDRYYYSMRSARPRDLTARAARFLYLNRTCWNGLYRENRCGQFNVPVGTKDIVLRDDDDFASSSALLSGAQLACGDFEEIVEKSGSGDLIFVDPPYTVKHNKNGFVRYNENIFTWADQVRLMEALTRARRRGANIVATNADHPSVRDLYSDFTLRSLTRRSSIGALSSARGITTELLITN